MPPPSSPHHPVVVEHAARRAADIQLRIADAITTFAGSMPFVYIHAVAFACWMLFVESDPWPKLTLIVSLEAIFLSTFVMIGQNRQAEFQRAKADHDFVSQEQELRLNTELTREIHTLTTELHGHVLGGGSRRTSWRVHVTSSSRSNKRSDPGRLCNLSASEVRGEDPPSDRRAAPGTRPLADDAGDLGTSLVSRGNHVIGIEII